MEDPLRNSGDKVAGEGRALIKADATAVSYERRDPYASVGTVALEEGVALSVAFRQYIYMMVKRRRLILRTALAFFVLGIVLTLLQTRLYTATVRIQIEREPAKVVEGVISESGTDTLGGDSFLKTQEELLNGRQMAERVVSALHLSHDDKFLGQFSPGLVGWLRSAVGWPIALISSISSLFGQGDEQGEVQEGEPDIEGFAADMI